MDYLHLHYRKDEVVMGVGFSLFCITCMGFGGGHSLSWRDFLVGKNRIRFGKRDYYVCSDSMEG